MLIFGPMAAPSFVVRHLVPVTVVLIAFYAFAGDETGQPAPRFRAKTTTGEQFNNDSIKGKVVLFELDHLVQILRSGSCAGGRHCTGVQE